MKKNLLIIILVITSMIVNAQNCFWAKRAGGTNNEEGMNIATDASGNVYVVGNDDGPSITFGSTTLSGFYNFIVKYSPSGTVLWAKSLGGEADGVITDNAGNVYITGSYGGTKSFGTTVLTAVGSVDVFIAKLDASGNFMWAKSAGGIDSDNGNKIATDGTGNLFITGCFYNSSATFGTTTLIHDPSTGPDFFIAKYDLSGNFIWAKNAGGNRDDNGYGITADAAGNSYVTGSFQSDSIKFGTTATLFSTAPGGYDMFIAKYDPSGNVLWSKGIEGMWGNTIAYDIKRDVANNLFMTGEFDGIYVKFGSDSLVNHSSGGADIFIAKYDSNGNPIWAKSAGGTNNDYSKSLSVDGTGNIYSIGYFTSPTLFFMADTSLTNSSGTASYNIFVSKYNNSGSWQWSEKMGGAGTDIGFGEAIATGTGDNVYFTGDFFSSSFSFGSTTLTNAGAYDYFVADVFSFNSAISSSTNATCYGSTDGAATTTISGGNPPYTYAWSTSPIQTTPNAIGLGAGIYTVTITEGYGCVQTSLDTITAPPADSAKICMVTVDSLSQHNVIIWDKTAFTLVDSFTVYREISTGNFQPIGTVAFDSLSEFVDTVRTRYFPNTGDPNVGTYRYKIKAKNSCGNFGPVSPYHNTIYIANTSGTFTWPQLYTIEGAANPVTSYILMRDDSTTGNWHAVGSVAGTQTFIVDPQYATYQSTASWRVETGWSISCTPTRSFSTSSVSNRFTNNTTAINENTFDNSFGLFPNPSNGRFTLQYKSANLKNEKTYIDVYNVFGARIYSSMSESNDQSIIDLSSQPSGIYFVKLKTDKQVFTRKIIVQ